MTDEQLKLADELDGLLDAYLLTDDEGENEAARVELADALWDNKAGIIAYLRAATRPAPTEAVTALEQIKKAYAEAPGWAPPTPTGELVWKMYSIARDALAALSVGEAVSAQEPIGIRWSRVNDDPFECAIQQGLHGDEFVKLLNGSCLCRPLAALPSEAIGRDEIIEECAKIADLWVTDCGHVPTKYLNARGYAVDAVKDVADAIRGLAVTRPTRGGEK